LLLENENIRLRAVEPEDLELLYRWENNPELWMVGNTRNPYSRYMLKRYILDSEKDIYENRQLRLMITIKSSNETIGTVDLFDFDIHNSRIALGLFIEQKFQRNGFAREALHLVEEYVFEFLKINQLYVQIAEENIPSMRMFEEENFEKNGMLKNWIKTTNDFQNIIVFQQFKNVYNKTKMK